MTFFCILGIGLVHYNLCNINGFLQIDRFLRTRQNVQPFDNGTLAIAMLPSLILLFDIMDCMSSIDKSYSPSINMILWYPLSSIEK